MIDFNNQHYHQTNSTLKIEKTKKQKKNDFLAFMMEEKMQESHLIPNGSTCTQMYSSRLFLFACRHPPSPFSSSSSLLNIFLFSTFISYNFSLYLKFISASYVDVVVVVVVVVVTDSFIISYIFCYF